MKLTNQIKSIAIGSFDGIHLGHQALLDQVDAIVIIERNTGYLTPGYQRSKFTNKRCCFYHFDKVKGLTPEEFVEKLMEDFPVLEKVVVGYDFRFGKGKSGNAELLSKMCHREVVVVEEVLFDGISVHSRVIKQYLREGNVKVANQLLGRRYQVEGEVIKGQGLGKKSLFPTLNLAVDHYQLPLEGVYVTRSQVGGTWYDSVSFLGHRMTTDDSYAVETHILDEEIEEMGGVVTISFVSFLRENQKFDTLEALKVQIGEDIASAKEILR
ncbi:MAG TPA: bifunctional riboflavin kinase/FAD synthetase [Epsilonproteobacteria bacterium]|nr:bifunctional riboflavin kinase/FAD synthetase [Campylobacterota bacterium]